VFKRHILRRGALVALACLTVGSALGSLTANAQPPDSIRVRMHQGERAPIGSENWTGGTIFGYEEGDQIRFRFVLSANGAAEGQMEVHFTNMGLGCEPFFLGEFQLLDIQNLTGVSPILTNVGVPEVEGNDWVQTLNVEFFAAGEAIVIYGLTLSNEAAACTGSSQHSRLFPGDEPGDVHQMGRQNVPVAAPAEEPPPASFLEVVKDLRPADDPGRFDLLINGSVEFANAGDGDTTGPVEVDPGSHVIGEDAGAGTDLADYDISIACETEAGEPVPVVLVPDGLDEIVWSVDVPEGEHVICTITNRALAQYDGGDDDGPDPVDSPFEDVGTEGDVVTTDDPSAPSTADPGTEVAGENLTPQPVSGDAMGGSEPIMDPAVLGVAGDELPRTGLPLAPQIISGLALIGLGQAARTGGRRRRAA
jgi:hypothetical protein